MQPQIKDFLKERGKELAIHEGEIALLLSFNCTLKEIILYLQRQGVKVNRHQLSYFINRNRLRLKAAKLAASEVRS
jgi:hypothetical protein